MSTKILLFVAALLTGCVANTVHRPFVPTTSTDKLLQKVNEGKIGELMCNDEKNSRACSETCMFVDKLKFEVKWKMCGSDNKEDAKLFFVEIDEQGRFYDDRQFQKLLDYLQDNIDGKKPCKDKDGSPKGPRGVSIVTVVHGWRHNSNFYDGKIEEDTNISDIKEVLSATYRAENSGNPEGVDCQNRAVVGVYIGWRGKSISLSPLINDDPLELLSIFDRKNTALNVSLGSIREVFSALQQFVKYRKPSRDSPQCANHKFSAPPCKLDRLIIVGHSFGGLVAFNAISEGLLNSILTGVFNQNKAKKESTTYPPIPPLVEMNADLVVLLNPAIEGIRFEPIYQAIKRRSENYQKDLEDRTAFNGFNKNQNPVLIVVSAKNDTPNKNIFPLMRKFTTFFEDDQPRENLFLTNWGEEKIPKFTFPLSVENVDVEKYLSGEDTRYETISGEEREARTKTLGNIPRYQTHKVINIYENKGIPKAEPVCWYDEKNKAETYVEWGNKFFAQSEAAIKQYYGNDINMYEAQYCSGIKLTYCGKGEGVCKIKEGDLPYNSPVWIIKSEDIRIVDGHNGFGVNSEIKHFAIPFIQQLYHQVVTNDGVDNYYKTFHYP